MDQYKAPSADEIPLGFGLSLAQNERALQHFAGMDAREKQRVLYDARHVRTKAEMKSLIDRIGETL